ncbi:hypothetical protein DSECCO2_479110 [anaerobic digester metagenome]
MIDIQTYHFSSPASRAAGFDRAGVAVQPLQKAHQSGGYTAAGKFLTGGPQGGEVGAGSGAALEQLGFRYILFRD